MQQPENITNIDVRVRVTVIMQRPDDGKICFARHRKNGETYWLLPGGGQSGLETATTTAARELEEELRLRAEAFELLFVRETMNIDLRRHIQFLVFKAVNPDFSTLATGDDPRVVGYDFFGADEIIDIPVYPAMKEDIIDYARGITPQLFKTLEWIP